MTLIIPPDEYDHFFTQSMALICVIIQIEISLWNKNNQYHPGKSSFYGALPRFPHLPFLDFSLAVMREKKKQLKWKQLKC